MIFFFYHPLFSHHLEDLSNDSVADWKREAMLEVMTQWPIPYFTAWNHYLENTVFVY